MSSNIYYFYYRFNLSSKTQNGQARPKSMEIREILVRSVRILAIKIISAFFSKKLLTNTKIYDRIHTRKEIYKKLNIRPSGRTLNTPADLPSSQLDIS